ncbi:MAG: TolC family protein [Acidobacteria bacterium]|nr:TolC family protein [Acidobacteriota bacterium]
MAARAETPITPAKAREMALQHNPSIETARRRLVEADARIRQARAEYFPQLGFSGIAKAGLSGAMNLINPMGLANSPFFRNLAGSFNVQFTGLDFGRREHRLALERQRREVIEAELRTREAEVLAETERGYYELLGARRLRSVAESIVRSHETIVRQAQAYYDAQMRSRVDVELARTALAGVQLRLVEAGNGVQVAAARFGRSLGGAQDTDYVPDEGDLGVARPEPLESLVKEAFRLRPELRSLAAEREALAEKVRLARSQRKPQFSLAFAGGYARFTDVKAEQLMATGLGLGLPLFTGGRLEGQIQEAKAAVRVLESRQEELRQQVEFEVRSAWLRVETALELVAVRKVQIESARQALRLASERYKERLGSAVELNAAQADFAQAAAGEVTALYDAKVAESALRFAAGQR